MNPKKAANYIYAAMVLIFPTLGVGKYLHSGWAALAVLGVLLLIMERWKQ